MSTFMLLLTVSILACFFLETAFGYKATSAVDLHRRDYNYSFEEFIMEYGKSYTAGTEEYKIRKTLFEKSLKEVQHHNTLGTHRWKKGINHLSDWKKEELKYMAGSRVTRTKVSSSYGRTEFKSTGIAIPDSVDWRKVPGVLTAVKDQGFCGSCWAFASAETIESRWALTPSAKYLVSDLSPQQIASCTDNPRHCGGTGGCEGGIAEAAFQSVIKFGSILTEWTYPYLSYYGKDYPCKLKEKEPLGFKVVSYVKLPSNELEPVLEALQGGPLAVTVDASLWHSYESGIFDGCNNRRYSLDHAVQLVGYGSDFEGNKFWIVRNSWGPTYGEHGFIRIVRRDVPLCGVDLAPQNGTGCDGGPDKIKVCGDCGILYDVSYPIIQDSKY